MTGERLLRPKQVYDKTVGYIPCSRAQYHKLIKAGIIPRPVRLGSMNFHSEKEILTAIEHIKAGITMTESH